MAVKLGSIGEQVDYDLRAGDSFGDEAQLLDDTGAPVNLTGATFDARLSRRDAGAGADVTITVTVPDAAQGRIKYELLPAATTGLDTSGNFFKPGPTYAWLLAMTLGTRTETLFYGTVNVAPRALP